MVQLSHPYMTTGKTVVLTIQTFVSKVMSLLFSMLFRFAIAFVPRSKCLLISWPRSAAQKNTSTFSPSVCLDVMGPDDMVFVFWMLNFKPAFSFYSSPSSRGSLAPLHFLPLEWYHLYIWSCWYFFWQSWFSLWLIWPSIAHGILCV